MNYAILSDIHGNFEALERALREVRRRKIDRIIILGDLVGYGPDPNACIELCRDATGYIILGNHDKAAIDPKEVEYFNPYAAQAVLWTAAQLSQQNKNVLASLPLVLSLPDILFVHASPLDPGAWNYVLSEYDARNNFDAFPQRICFIGHTHFPAIFCEKSFIEPHSSDISLSNKERYIINVGSIGQPRDSNPELSFGIFDDRSLEFEWVRLAYNIDATAQKILDAGLPTYLANRLYVGR